MDFDVHGSQCLPVLGDNTCLVACNVASDCDPVPHQPSCSYQACIWDPELEYRICVTRNTNNDRYKKKLVTLLSILCMHKTLHYI